MNSKTEQPVLDPAVPETEAPPVAAVAQEPAPEPPRYSERELGLVDEVGRALAPETRAIFYGVRTLWPEAVRLGELAGQNEQALFELARQIHSVRPETWREELMDRLNARLLDPVGSMTSEEKFRRGLQHDLQPRIEEAWRNLENAIRPMTEANQLKVLELLLRHLGTIR